MLMESVFRGADYIFSRMAITYSYVIWNNCLDFQIRRAIGITSVFSQFNKFNFVAYIFGVLCFWPCNGRYKGVLEAALSVVNG